MRATVMRSAVCCGGLLFVAACGPGASGPPAAVAVAVATFKPLPSGECPAALMAGMRLRGDGAAKPPVWVEDPQGKRFTVIWPNGFSARFDPKLVLLGSGGGVVARDGDLLDLGGGQVDPAYDWFACEVVNRTTSP
jgi:hypothetical protein